MTKYTIKEKMIEMMQANIEGKLMELVQDEIDDETINEFLWSKNYGEEFAKDYFEVMKDELIEEYLDEIYDTITYDDIDSPW